MTLLMSDVVKFLSFLRFYNSPFYNVCLVTWPWSGSEAGVDIALTQTSLLFICKYHDDKMIFYVKSSELCNKTQSSPIRSLVNIPDGVH